MKQKEAVLTVFTRMAAILVFAALCAVAILLSTGTLKFDFSVFEDGTTVPAETGGDTSPESSISATDTPSAATDTLSPDTEERSALPDDTTQTPADVYEYPSLAELEAAGYRVSYSSWTDGMELALVFENGFLSKNTSDGNIKTEESLVCITYQEDGIEFPSYVVSRTERDNVEVYMGYILVDTGKGRGTDILPVYRETASESGETITQKYERTVYDGVYTLTIYTSSGKFIGTYKADLVMPAYTRDTSDRALFKYNNAYYYIDEATGDFLLSDYNDDIDNRGLYFDYNPSYGKSDNSLQKYATEAEVSFTYILDTSVYYTANQVDWRIAKELTLANPAYAQQVARRNYPFQKYYYVALKEIQAEEASRAAETSASEPETSQEPEQTTAETQTLTETVAAPDPTDALTSSPESSAETLPLLYSSEPVDITVPDTLPSEPGASSAVPDDTSVPADDGSSVMSDEGSSGISSDDSSSDESSEEQTEPETTADPHITVTRTYTALRFTFAKKQPEVDTEKTITQKYTGYSSLKQNIEAIISWQGQYAYAKAFNFSGGRAVTVDDNGMLRIINTSLTQVIYLNKHYSDASYFSGYQTHTYYTEPFDKDVTMLGHYYYDNGLLRVRKVIAPYHMSVTFNSTDILIDTSGNEYTLPAGYTLYAYSEGIIILENDGKYGAYHKDGYWIAQPDYTSAQPFVEGLCVLGRTAADGSTVYGVIDKKGNTVIPFAYSKISNCSTGVIAAYSDEYGWQVFAKVSK